MSLSLELQSNGGKYITKPAVGALLYSKRRPDSEEISSQMIFPPICGGLTGSCAREWLKSAEPVTLFLYGFGKIVFVK